jgi:hypothetical protein
MSCTSNQLCRLLVLLVAMATATACLPKTKPTMVDLPRGEKVGVRQARALVNEVAAELAGRIESAAQTILDEADDARVRRAALMWRGNAVPALQRSSFRPDPIMALADLWLLVVQMQDFGASDRGKATFGPQIGIFVETTRNMEQFILDFIKDNGGQPEEHGVVELIHDFARQNLIEHSLSSRPTVAPALLERLRQDKMGAFASVGSMVESLGDLSDRLTIYGEQLPRQARWQAEILMFDAGLEYVDVESLTADMARLGRVSDHVIELSDQMPGLIDERIEILKTDVEATIESIDFAALQASMDEMVSAHKAVALQAITAERIAALAAVHEERVAAMTDAERIGNEIVDRSFARVESMIDTRIDGVIARLVPLGVVLMAGPFVLGLLAGWVLRRRSSS